MRLLWAVCLAASALAFVCLTVAAEVTEVPLVSLCALGAFMLVVALLMDLRRDR